MVIGKYEKIVILSTLAEPKSLVDISLAWFGNKGRLYQNAIRKEIEQSIKKGHLIRVGKTKIKANTHFFIRQTLRNLSFRDEASRRYLDLLSFFYSNLGQYTQKVYLNFEVIKMLASESGRLNYHKGNDIDLGFLLQLPFVLRVLERKKHEPANYIMRVFQLGKYKIVTGKLELQHCVILHEHAWGKEWADCFLKVEQLFPECQK